MAQFQQWGDDAGLQNQHEQQVLSTKPDIADPSKWEYADLHELLNMWDIEVLPEPPSRTDEEKSAYELHREARIAANMAKLRDLGLV